MIRTRTHAEGDLGVELKYRLFWGPEIGSTYCLFYRQKISSFFTLKTLVRMRYFQWKFFPDFLPGFLSLRFPELDDLDSQNLILHKSTKPFSIRTYTLSFMPMMDMLAARYREYRAAGYSSKDSHRLAFQDVTEVMQQEPEPDRDPYLSVVYSNDEGIWFLHFCTNLYYPSLVLSGMTIERSATRNGKPGHIVHVAASERWVPADYTGKDPRTKAKHKSH